MQQTQSLMQRPQRWNEPFDPGMSDDQVADILRLEPFVRMNPHRFPKSIPLAGIVRNDCRWMQFSPGDIIVREGDYGSSAFLIVTGEAWVALKSLPAKILGRSDHQKNSWFRSLSQLWANDKHAEVRRYQGSQPASLGLRQVGDQPRVFLHDIPRILSPEQTETIQPSEIFGEISALTRTPRSATVVAGQDSTLVEIRWQGLRELMKYDAALREHIESRYRVNSLKSHLREVSLFSRVPPEQLHEIAAQTQFESYGSFQWNIDYRSTQTKDVAERILDEPVIVNQGDYINGLYLVRNGFVRVCRRHGTGIQTVAYAGRGGMFGMSQIISNWQSGKQQPWELSLRAVGYVDILRIPVDVVQRFALQGRSDIHAGQGNITPNSDLGPLIDRRRQSRGQEMHRGLLEFLVEQRFVNGTKAMMIDLDRCTRCDDCVRACAATHNNNPRFNRQGPVHDHYMLANACMHCADPVCMIGCPTGAISRDFTTGNVTINDETCIGCATCAQSCPYQNIQMVEINDKLGHPIVDSETREPILKATKCDYCVEQLGGPACQRACPHDALIRIDLTSPQPVTQWTQ